MVGCVGETPTRLSPLRGPVQREADKAARSHPFRLVLNSVEVSVYGAAKLGRVRGWSAYCTSTSTTRPRSGRGNFSGHMQQLTCLDSC